MQPSLDIPQVPPRSIGRALERRGVLVRDAESSFLELEPAAGGAMADLLGHSITYRVAIGSRAGQKVFSLQTVPARKEELRKGVAQYAGFSLHAGLGVEADQREKLERLARYPVKRDERREPAAGVGGAPVADGAGARALSAEDPVSRQAGRTVETGRRTSCWSPWTSSPAWRRWSRRRACT
jgi:hypothetical protein